MGKSATQNWKRVSAPHEKPSQVGNQVGKAPIFFKKTYDEGLSDVALRALALGPPGSMQTSSIYLGHRPTANKPLDLLIPQKPDQILLVVG